ncbi:1-aminocyclopropane-1-carboxylate synthase-like protein 1 isoform X3 [Gigantopelta aegis]|uniref:1-aminocyclopropane-1-carboxylate synthase-like protein 1 isoform X1 n=1 Tax=Gigantopelta aegis TaxID=1735272 RepID=UPI001B887A0E|nr:1-aminocyclopropane-1-carboxylate synthase-like protein 1 isoform X1 [Gigantopelta aegis]XP_041354231.1 1-aminocyclopropane-1-carboxylate synthase-like protein 1 isoform X2 [Gigantopelta aegis]XP_041354232.1 1-aminocyclopropane-1-carboxylate synthase-like protein 1 isoform X3 [Gigantopelta aegis]
MSKYLREKTVAAEQRLQDRFIEEGKVYILGGTASYCAEPGWFRIVFSTKKEFVEEGLRRIETVLLQEKNGSQKSQFESLIDMTLSFLPFS